MRIVASAPGKVILSGEHAVVHGYPALVAATNKRSTITFTGDDNPALRKAFVPTQPSLAALFQAWKELDTTQELQIDSTIPSSRGMGSSAACSVAMSAIIHRLRQTQLDLELVNRLAYAMEHLQHKVSSGVDNTIATYGSFLWYRKESPNFSVWKQLTGVRSLDSFYLLDSGKAQETTGEMVAAVERRRQDQPQRYQRLFQEIEQVTRSFLPWLFEETPVEVASLIQENHRLLLELEVVSPQAQELIAGIEQRGGVAKVTGAGGQAKGSGYLLVYHPEVDQLQPWLTEHHLELEPLELGGEGVKVHEAG